MFRITFIFCLLLGARLGGTLGWAQTTSQTDIRILLSEVKPFVASSEQTCTIVFPDHRFHHEKAILKHGREFDRKVYEGELSDAEWNDLAGIIDSKEFRELVVPRGSTPIVLRDAHPYTISVGRAGRFQNMEFLDSNSIKPYQAQIRPLLQWWKSLRGRHMTESSAPASERCIPDKGQSVISE